MHRAMLKLCAIASAEALIHDVHFWTDAYGYCKPVR